MTQHDIEFERFLKKLEVTEESWQPAKTDDNKDQHKAAANDDEPHVDSPIRKIKLTKKTGSEQKFSGPK